MSEQPPILESKPVADEQKQLIALFNEMEKGQIDFLDQAGKRIIELTTGLLGVLFAVTAFGKDFPPPYLKNNTVAPWLVVLTLILYLGAMFMGMRTVQPRSYKLYRHNLAGMKEELEKIVNNKSRSLRWAGILFWIASLFLAALVTAIIFGV